MYVSDCLFFSIMLLLLVIMGFIAINDHFTTHDWEKSHHRTLRNRLEDGIKQVDVVKVKHNPCCMDKTKICMACEMGITVDTFCKEVAPLHKEDFGCVSNLKAIQKISNKKTLDTSSPLVDVVYLWVNGTKNKPRDNSRLNEVSTPNRFRQWNELKYSIELLRENAMNLGNIFIITNGNRPNYPNVKKDVTFIDHSEFIPKKYLPTFSSYTIQFNLDGIFKHVSDPFILLDDDFFITKKLDLRKYVLENKWFVESWGQNWSPGSSTDHFVQAIKNSNKVLKQVYKNFKQFGAIAHMPIVIRKKTFSKMKELIDTTVSMTKYRSITSLQFQYTMAAVDKYSFHSNFVKASGLYNFVMMNNLSKLKKDFKRIAKQNRGFLTLNDDIKKVGDHGYVINTFLSGLVLKSNELNRVDIDNSISKNTNGNGNIIFFNALRGKEWKKTCELLKKNRPRILFLNEMDWGMARTNNEHTTKRLASCLNMNYVFGVEFIELTKGNEQEQRLSKGKDNTWAWHGNAILSTDKIEYAEIIRLPGTEQFWKNGLKGKEQRKGGRMAISAMIGDIRVICTHLDFFVGQSYNKKSLHTLGKMFTDNKIILAGDLGTPGRDATTPNVLKKYEYDDAWSINTHDKKGSGDWFMSKGVTLDTTNVIDSGDISDHNIILTKEKSNFFFLDNCGKNKYSYACKYYDKTKNIDMVGVLESHNMEIVHGEFQDEVMDISEVKSDFISFIYMSMFKDSNGIFVSTVVSMGANCGIYQLNENKLNHYMKNNITENLKQYFPAWVNVNIKNTLSKMNRLRNTYSLIELKSINDCSINYQENEYLIRMREGESNGVDSQGDIHGYTFYKTNNLKGKFEKIPLKFKDELSRFHYAIDTAVGVYRDIHGVLRTTVRKEIPYSKGSSRGYRGIAFLYQCGNYWCEESEFHIDDLISTKEKRKYGPQIYSNRVSKIGNVYYLIMGIYYAHGKFYNGKKVEAEIAIAPSKDGIYFDIRYAYSLIHGSSLFKNLFSIPSASNLIEQNGKLIYLHGATYDAHGDGKNLKKGILKRPMIIKRSVDKDKLFGLYSTNGKVLLPSGNLTIITDCNLKKHVYYKKPTYLKINGCTIYKVIST